RRRFARPALATSRASLHLLHPPLVRFASLNPIATPDRFFPSILTEQKVAPTLLPDCGLRCQRAIPDVVAQEDIGCTQGIGTATRPAIVPWLARQPGAQGIAF